MRRFFVLLVVFLFFLPLQSYGKVYPHSFIDSTGSKITVSAQPRRIVSLVPSVTEMLKRIGAADSVIGMTYHSVMVPEPTQKTIVGGFFRPDMDRVATLKPDMIFYGTPHEELVQQFKNTAVLVRLTANSINDAFHHIRLLGALFGKEREALAIISEEQRQLSIIAAKIKSIPAKKRKRVMRIMGRDKVSAPGDDSFQNKYIQLAGGIPPVFDENGSAIPVTLDQWRRFNPQVIYGCGDDRKLLKKLEGPGWREVEAIRNKQVFFFPCDLTCRAATHPGFFVSWLAATIYRNEFSDPDEFINKERIVKQKKVDIHLDYVDRADIVYSDIKDFRQKTLLVRLKQPVSVVSTLEGQRENITAIANHYFPPPAWGLGHSQGVGGLRSDTLEVLGLHQQSTSMLFTGADMDNLAVVKKSFREMEVIAAVTAGVQGNAMRMVADTGLFYEPDSKKVKKNPGTINILLLTNMKLSPRAMTRAIISVTEGKTAALQDMDIRSSYSSRFLQATGTGTDNVLVVGGTGIEIDGSGGHTKMGELIARAVYEGVIKAVGKQNGLSRKRSIFLRLKERKINLYDICSRYGGGHKARRLTSEMERLLFEPYYSGFLTAVMAISDQYEQGLISDTGVLESWINGLANQIAAKEIVVQERDLGEYPVLLEKGLLALLAGAYERVSQPTRY